MVRTILLIGCLLPLAAAAELDITNHGYLELYDADGNLVSRHSDPKEVYESASRQPPGTYTVPGRPQTIVVTGSTEPPAPEPEPEPEPEPPAPEPEPDPTAPYDLSAYDIPAETMCPWPTAPQTSASVTVSSPAELQAAVDQGNIEVHVGWTGTRSGDISIRRDDVRVVMPNTATLDGSIRVSSRQNPIARVAWIGGNQTSGTFTLDQADDVLFQGFHSTKDSRGNSATVNDMRCSPGGCNRVAFVSTTFDGVNPGPLDSYVFYTAPNPEPSRCMILADFLARQAPGGSHVARIQANQQLILARTAWIQPDQGGTAFRFHRNVTDAFIGDSVVVGRVKLDTISAGDSVSVTNGVFDDVDVFNSHNCFPATEAGVTNSGEWKNSTLHTLQSCDTSFRTQSLRDGGGNSVVGWDGSLPSVEGHGAQR